MECFEMFKVFGDDAIPRACVFEWQRFSYGREEVEWEKISENY